MLEKQANLLLIIMMIALARSASANQQSLTQFARCLCAQYGDMGISATVTTRFEGVDYGIVCDPKKASQVQCIKADVNEALRMTDVGSLENYCRPDVKFSNLVGKYDLKTGAIPAECRAYDNSFFLERLAYDRRMKQQTSARQPESRAQRNEAFYRRRGAW